MFHILIADDEPLTRKFLANNIPALCSDFQVTGIACNGLEAMELCKKQYFDVIITDIRMPEMDGLALCKFLFESKSNCRLVIISGYNEFEYARTALRYQVSDYILKPINDDHLKEILVTIKEELLCQKKEDGIASIFSQLENRALSFSNALGCIIRLSLDELRLFLLQENGYDKTTHQIRLLKICRDYCQTKNLPFYYDKQNAVQILFQGNSPDEIYQEAFLCYEELKILCSNEFFPHLIMTFGSCFVDILDAELSENIAIRAFALTLKNKHDVISYSDYEKNLPFLEELYNACEAIYLTYLKSDCKTMKLLFPTYLDLFFEHNNVGGILGIVSFLIRHICDRSNIKTHYTQSAYRVLTESLNQMIYENDFSDTRILSLLEQSISCLMTNQKIFRTSESNQLTDSAKQYIYAHFNKSISLSSLADELNVNSCYLSDMIHKHLGESYSKFLLRVRMERAVEIMKNNPDEKIYVISEKIGFVSPKHFIAVFKKFFGVTPSVYISQNFKT